MPNRCENTVWITVKKPEDLDKIIQAIRGDGLFATFVPRDDDIRKDWMLEMLYWWNGYEWRKEHNFPEMWLDWKKEWYSECPYKQLWYDWQRKHWWAKRDFQDEKFEPHDKTETYMQFRYESPWCPHYEWRQQISEKLWCQIDLSYSEPWCNFSWEIRRIDWDEVRYNHRDDDAYFWNWKRCCICGWIYDNECDDDWYDIHHSLCQRCAGDLDPKKLKKYESK